VIGNVYVFSWIKATTSGALWLCRLFFSLDSKLTHQTGIFGRRPFQNVCLFLLGFDVRHCLTKRRQNTWTGATSVLVPRVFASLISLFGTFCSTVALPAFNWGRLSKEMDPTRCAAGHFCIAKNCTVELALWSRYGRRYGYRCRTLASRTRSPRSNYYFLLISATKAYAKQATIFRAQTIL